MHNITHSIIRSAQESLSIAAGQASSDEGRYFIDMTRQMLNFILVSHECLPAFMREQEEILNGALGAADFAAGRDDVSPSVDRAISHMAELIAASSAMTDPFAAERMARIGQGLILPLERAGSEIARRQAAPSGGGSAPARLSVDDVNAYLSRRRPPAPVSGVTAIDYLPGGYSRETIRLKPADGAPFEGDIVLRKGINGGDVSRLEAEWNLLCFAHRNGLPVPPPLWFEADPGHLGNSFFAVGLLPGRNSGDVFGSKDPIAPETVTALARILARLHRMEVSSIQATPQPSLTNSEEILARINVLSQASEDPLFRLVIAWLRANLPQSPRPALIHGDIGFHNLLLENSAVTGVLDWEVSHLGDPAEELAYVRPSIEKFVDWDAFLQDYVAAGGAIPPDASLKFYTVYQDIWRAAACFTKRDEFLAQETPPLAQGVPAFIFGPMFLTAAARTAFSIPPLPTPA